MFLGVVDDPCDSGERGYFFRSALRVASGDKDLAGWILAMDAADRGAKVSVSSGGDRAAIQYDNLRHIECRSARKAANYKILLNGSTIGLRCAAAKILDNVSGHGSIIAIDSGGFSMRDGGNQSSCSSIQPDSTAKCFSVLIS